MSISFFCALDRVINLLVLVTSSVFVRYIGPMDFFLFFSTSGKPFRLSARRTYKLFG